MNDVVSVQCLSSLRMVL